MSSHWRQRSPLGASNQSEIRFQSSAIANQPFLVQPPAEVLQAINFRFAEEDDGEGGLVVPERLGNVHPPAAFAVLSKRPS